MLKSSDNDDSIVLTPPPKDKPLKRSEYQFGCTNCKKRFLSEVLLQVHIMMDFCQTDKSQIESMKKCTECGKAFKTNFSLTRHKTSTQSMRILTAR